MTTASPGASFSLTYELQPDDLQELLTARFQRKRQRARLIFAWALMNAVFITLATVTVALVLPSVVKNAGGAPSLLYVVDAAIWVFVARGAVAVWRMSPKRLARRVWRSNSQLHGRHQDQVGPGGITWIAPDGTQESTPWADIDYIHETENHFHLIDHHGATLSTLPKRGLPSPGLIPALREFLNHSVNEVISEKADRTPGL